MAQRREQHGRKLMARMAICGLLFGEKKIKRKNLDLSNFDKIKT
jgi:hypothetical protein